MGIAPFKCRHAEEGDVQYVCLAGIYAACLLRRHFRRNEILLDGIRVDMVVYFREFSLGRPSQQSLFLLFQPLELLDKIQLELHGNPAGKLERDVALRIRPASGTVFRQDADTPGQFHPP